jgi:hypothetical protein
LVSLQNITKEVAMNKQILSLAIACSTVFLGTLPSFADTTIPVIRLKPVVSSHGINNPGNLVERPKGGPGPHGGDAISAQGGIIHRQGEWNGRPKGGPGPHGGDAIGQLQHINAAPGR